MAEKKNGKLKDSTKIRLYLFFGSTLTIVMVAAFLVILNINEPKEYTTVPFNVLWILTLIACIALALFYFRGPVFDLDGKLEAANINAMLLSVLVVIQLAFFFEIIAVRNQIINYNTYDTIRTDFDIAQGCEEDELDETFAGLCDEVIQQISVSDEDGKVLYSSDPDQIGEQVPVSKYHYPFSQDRNISFVVDQGYNFNQLKSVVLNLLTVLVTSIFFTVEIVLLMLRVISRHMEKKTAAVSGEKMTLSSLYYIRQISFLFYFASRLSSAFIPIMAKSLYNPFPGLADTTAAGLPQSAETLLTCSAIFLTTLILEKKGWKMPFISGLFMVALGTFLSAVSGNLVLFILARSVVGLGYGFAWMTLRNLSLFGKDDKEQLVGFALLNAGIYAGMNCGASLGAILAEIFGYKTVFFVSAALTVLSSVSILRMENAILPKRRAEEAGSVAVKEQRKKISSGQILIAVLFTVLMIWPASIAASYLSYYLPLYFEEIGRSVTDVGRAQLLYGVVIVYGGPALASVVASFKGSHLRNVSFVYNIMISVSLFLAGLGSGIFLPFAGAALLGAADSFGFGVHNNYFLDLPVFRRMGRSKALSILSFIKKMFEMTGPFVFATAIVFGYQMGIRSMAFLFAAMAVLFMVCCSVMRRE